jgi:hypothetical protein
VRLSRLGQAMNLNYYLRFRSKLDQVIVRNNHCNHLDNTKRHNKVARQHGGFRRKEVNQMSQVLFDLRPSSRPNIHQLHSQCLGMKFFFQPLQGDEYLHRVKLSRLETNLSRLRPRLHLDLKKVP